MRFILILKTVLLMWVSVVDVGPALKHRWLNVFWVGKDYNHWYLLPRRQLKNLAGNNFLAIQ